MASAISSGPSRCFRNFSSFSEQGRTMNKNSCTRRDFLKTASAATLAALSAGAPKLWAAEPLEKIEPTADTVIVLWMAGGMAHTETFDPKRYAPFEKGMDPKGMLSTFPAIDTSV